MKRAEIKVGEKYIATQSTSKYDRRLGVKYLPRVEVLEVGVKRFYNAGRSHERIESKEDGVRVRFLNDATSDFGTGWAGDRRPAMPYDNGSCAKGDEGVIETRQLWMTVADYREQSKAEEDGEVAQEREREAMQERLDAVNAVLGSSGSVARHSGLTQVSLYIKDAEKVAAVVQAARSVIEHDFSILDRSSLRGAVAALDAEESD